MKKKQGAATLGSGDADALDPRRGFGPDAPAILSEDVFSQLFHLSPEAVCISSVPDGRLIALSDSFERVFGHSREQVIGKTALEIGLWADLEEREHIASRLKDDGLVQDMEYSFLTKSGQRREGLLSSTIVEVAGERFAISATRDVTEGRRTEHAYRESDEQLRQALEAANMGTWSWDIASTKLTWSKNVAALLGVAPDRVPVTSAAYQELIHPEDRDFVAAAGERALRTGEPFRAEFRTLRSDGTLMWLQSEGRVFVDEDDNPMGMRGTISDITIRKEAEEQLRVTQFAIDHAADIVAWVGSDARFVYVNEQACRTYGYSREELLCMTVHDVDLGFPADEWSGLWESIVRTGSMRRESICQRKDGTTLPVELNLVYINFNGKEYVSGFVRDLTEQKRAEAALRESEARLKQAQKMEAIGLLAGSVAHDFNNILTVIAGYSDLILNAGEIKRGTRERLEEIAKASERAASLTRQLLTFSRGQVLQPQVLDLRAVLSNMENMLGRIIGEDIELRSVSSADVGHVRADLGQMEQVIMNLAVNARDAMPRGGKLTITTDLVELGQMADPRFEGLKPGAYVRLTVTDTGNGIPEELESRLFEPFFTTKERGRGTGLGLSIVYGIVKQSEGMVYASNAPGAGARFEILLPRKDEVASTLTLGPAASGGGTGTILLVEDDQAIRALTNEILSEEGYALLLAADGEQALRVLETDGNQVDLLVTDVVMPRMNGVELANHAKERFPRVKILYVTGYTDDAISPLGLSTVASEILLKPFTKTSLVSKVGEMMAAGAGSRTDP